MDGSGMDLGRVLPINWPHLSQFIPPPIRVSFSRSSVARELRGFSLGSSRNLWRVLWGHIKCRIGWMDYLPIAIAPLPPFGSICIPIEHLASGGPDYGDGESRMVVAQEMEG